MQCVDLGDIDLLLKEKYSFEGFTTDKVANLDEMVLVSLDRNSRSGFCPECGRQIRAEELIRRKVRGLDLIKPCYIEFLQARIRCKCGYRGMEKIDFAERYSRYTKRFEEHVALLSKRLKISDIADLYGLDLKTVKNIQVGYFRSKKDG